MSLEEEASEDQEEVCAALHRQGGRVDEAVLCVVVLAGWVLVLWDEVLLLQATPITVRVLTAKDLLHANSHRTVRVTGAHLHSLLWR